MRNSSINIQNMKDSPNGKQEVNSENWFTKHFWEIIVATTSGLIVLFIGIFLKFRFGL